MKYHRAGKRLLNDRFYRDGQEKSTIEERKSPSRTEIINFLLSRVETSTRYLEIGVANPDKNFLHVMADEKYGVDPGKEFVTNPVDFRMTSDEFFDRLSADSILSSDIRFDVIFIDGAHLAEQVDRDIDNSLRYIEDDGFIVLHDCNPPTEWHARENYYFRHTPARGFWNGTTWKAFLKWRFDPSVYSCCIDSDWGVGVLSKTQPVGQSIEKSNEFFEFGDFDLNRVRYLNLVSFNAFKNLLSRD